MDIEAKNKLEKLKKENKARVAKEQLINDLIRNFSVDISNRVFVDYHVSEDLHKRLYEKIRTEEIKSIRFYYDIEKLKEMLDKVFHIFSQYKNNNVLFYPIAFGYFFRSSNQIYLNHPIAILLTLFECEDMVKQVAIEINDDLIVITEDLSFGFVISEDEYSYITIEYWGSPIEL